MSPNLQYANWQNRLHEIIFEADTRAGKWFDIFLILAILLSVLVVMLDSVTAVSRVYGRWFLAAEWALALWRFWSSVCNWFWTPTRTPQPSDHVP